MKKIIFLLSVFFLTATFGEVMAGPCLGTTRLNGSAILALFKDKLICAQSTNNTDRWAEEHLLTSNGGPLWEHAKGQGHPIDPRRLAGTWAIGSDPSGTIIYNYTGNPVGNPYEWSVWTSGTAINAYEFCTANGTSEVARAQVKALPATTDPNPCNY